MKKRAGKKEQHIRRSNKVDDKERQRRIKLKIV